MTGTCMARCGTTGALAGGCGPGDGAKKGLVVGWGKGDGVAMRLDVGRGAAVGAAATDEASDATVDTAPGGAMPAGAPIGLPWLSQYQCIWTKSLSEYQPSSSSATGPDPTCCRAASTRLMKSGVRLE